MDDLERSTPKDEGKDTYVLSRAHPSTEDRPISDGEGPTRGPSRIPALLVLTLALLPPLSVVWGSSWFIAQDGPAHLYNAHVLRASLRADSVFRETFAVRWQPLPNWAGHLLAMTVNECLAPRSAERALASTTLIALASACFFLRRRVAGPAAGGTFSAAVVSTLLALNMTWLLGFTSFLLGASLFAVTLAVWWEARDRAGPALALKLGVLLILGYFCHPVSLGPTVFGLAVLILFTPGGRRPRALWTTLATIPLFPLGLAYLSMTRQGGPLSPIWGQLNDPLNWRDWLSQLGWIDPISLAAKSARPFSLSASGANIAFAPVLWFSLGLGLITWGSRRSWSRESRAWLILAGVLLTAGTIGPDTLGLNHGHYLPQRIFLLGLVALLPVLDFGRKSTSARIGRLALLVAWGLQTLWVLDYAMMSTDRASSMLQAQSKIGRNQRVATVLADERNRFRSNPLLHLDCLLGIGTGNVIWSNYETRYYYFPVQLRHPETMPSSSDFEAVARLVGPDEGGERAQMWAALLDRYPRQIDVVLAWGLDERIERINSERYERCNVAKDQRLRVWSGPKSSGSSSRELDLPPASKPVERPP